MSDSTYRLLIFRYLFILSAGIYLYFEKDKKHNVVGQVCMSLIGAVFLFATQYLQWVPFGLEKWTTTCWLACFYLLPIAARVLRCPMHSRMFEELGRASYHIFFIQMLYYGFFAEYLYKQFPLPLLQLFISLLCSIGFGYAFYKIESPISNWILTHWKQCTQSRE